MRNKKIQILLVFVLAIGLFGLLFYWRYGEKKQMESLNGLQETYKEYDKKIREIRNDMENKKAEVNDIEKPANVILAFSEEDQELMDRIVPALEGRGIQATLRRQSEQNRTASSEIFGIRTEVSGRNRTVNKTA